MDEIDYRVSEIFRVLGNGLRLHIVKLLREGPRTVSDLAAEIDRPVQTVSGHLQKLNDQELVEAESEGRHHPYELKRPDVIDHCLQLRELVSREERN